MESDAGRLYRGTLVAAPMVRGSSHVFRMACLRYGADVVFSPGCTDLMMIPAVRSEENGHTTFRVESNGHDSVVFRTCEEEREKLVFQLVSSDGPNAVKAMRVVEDVVAGFDLNCGCPEHFAVHRGCGSSMELENAVDVVKTLSRETRKPVSVKFRVNQDVEKSIQFAQAVESAGAAAITVHGRLKEQKHSGGVDYDKMKTIFESVKIWKIGNGGVTSVAEADEMKARTGCDSVMIGTAAMKNPSVFSREPVSQYDVLCEMIDIGKRYRIPFMECKWSLQQITPGGKLITKQIGQQITQCKTWEELDSLMADSQ